MYRDRSAPMQWERDTPVDPGLFSVTPHKRLRTETGDGQHSNWINPHPIGAPLLFASQIKAQFPSSSSSSSSPYSGTGFAQYQQASNSGHSNGNGNEDQENRMMVDDVMMEYGGSSGGSGVGVGFGKSKREDPVDVEMESVDHQHHRHNEMNKSGDQDNDHPQPLPSASASTSKSSAASASSSTSNTRPISLNAVKKTAKHDRQVQAQFNSASGSGSGKGKDRQGSGGVEDQSEIGSLVRYAGDVDDQEDKEGEVFDQPDNSPFLSRFRNRRRSPHRPHRRNEDHLPHSNQTYPFNYSQHPLSHTTAPQYHGNSYHLHVGSGAGAGASSGTGGTSGGEIAATGGNGGGGGLTLIEREERLRNGNGSGIKHSELPYIFLGYLQFVFNAAVVLICLYLVVTFILTIRNDVKQRMAAYSTEIMQDISSCTSLYIINRCEPSTRIPAMEKACSDWQTCMSRDPTVVGHARVGAEMFANVITTFVDELSWKTIFFILAFSTCLIFITNSALFNLRAKHASTYHQQPQPHDHQTQYRPPQQSHFHWPPHQDTAMPGGDVKKQI